MYVFLLDHSEREREKHKFPTPGLKEVIATDFIDIKKTIRAY